MFITVMFGAGCRELVNPWCSLVTLTAHLRQRGRVPPDATIALLAEDGHLVSLGSDLEEGTSQAPSSSGSPLLQERGTYVLVQIINGESGAPTRYESLLENLDGRCPELAEALRRLSGLPPLGNSRRRRTGTRTGTRRGHQDQGPPSRSQRLGSLLSRPR
ncbi:PREDICTED: uncharacterized protein C22orf15 homolog isoform X3 [Myotis davidii]|uniref:Uncharacterized protein n=1 Tax=Myotis davidii TaxID=225400 RepID=L5LIZ2_MYODS|nr:PREDICTED: uncharacterized protein C22orf15 homolog isoform X3 [Myotis davidii]XP_015422810.1 PREDICTED: uncharacterized protein C22orf15 homolog isoform X3 [Myotis davidii]ELK26294.1 hypothetical protein MDA_GLEAN10020158 [Myotis davidii]